MNTCHICNKAVSNLPVCLEQFPLDEKAVYVESVLELLIESRYGPAYSFAYLEDPDGFPADESVSFLDLIADGCAAWYAAVDSQGRTFFRLQDELGMRKGISRKERQETSNEFQGRNFASHVSNLSPTNLSRGSPGIPETQEIWLAAGGS